MTHQPYDRSRETTRFSDIIARNETHVPLGKQVLNGLGGMVALLIIGVMIVLVVLWKSP